MSEVLAFPVKSVPPAHIRWGGPAGISVALHALALVALVVLAKPFGETPLPDPVMLVELPPLPPPASTTSAEQPQQQVTPPQVTPDQPTPPIDAPKIAKPVPSEVAQVPVRPVQATPRPTTPAPAVTPAPATPVPAAQSSIGDDPKAKKAEVDYFQTLLAYIRRNKTYPSDALKAREQGTPSIRFTVDRRGNVSGESLKRSSGHGSLDSAALALVRRISPMPPMPAAMKRESVTVSVPIEYTLKN